MSPATSGPNGPKNTVKKIPSQPDLPRTDETYQPITIHAVMMIAATISANPTITD